MFSGCQTSFQATGFVFCEGEWLPNVDCKSADQQYANFEAKSDFVLTFDITFPG